MSKRNNRPHGFGQEPIEEAGTAAENKDTALNEEQTEENAAEVNKEETEELQSDSSEMTEGQQNSEAEKEQTESESDKPKLGKHGRPLKTDPYGNLI